ncbi:MAG: M1 family metallopeptidase [Balneolales bacterium]
MNVTRLFIISSSLAILTACGPTQILDQAPGGITAGGEAENGWFIPEGEEQQSRKRTWDLRHQKLWVRFDFEHERVNGLTELFLTSLDDGNTRIILDAKAMDIDSVYTVHTSEHLEFKNDSSTLSISLPEAVDQGDSLFVAIRYASTRPERGLYFIDPLDLDPVRPTQVWTLGQPEDNSFWFPTIDSPLERATQETWISVPEPYKTLSNGALIESRVMPGDSLRTDYWVMDKPHSPYLFALAVGDYSVSSSWNHDTLFKYFTEPAYAEYADLIYENTEDMLDYIETKTGVAYPWGIYAQVPVRGFIASGMENTTASILYDGVQIDERARLDISHQGLIMHELIHQWFGNYVTAKNWANLPLNEGFANYFEILYSGHRQGDSEAVWNSLDNRDEYFTEARRMRRPVIFNRYTEPEDMYDSHTYAKTGQILRMLHDYVGEETWWTSLNAYLSRFAFDEVDVSDLQDVFEQQTGRDLSWFFDQWFHQPGHPEMEVTADTAGNEVQVRIRQVQDMERQPVFRLHTTVQLRTSGSVYDRPVIINKADSTYRFSLCGTLEDVILDPDGLQLAEVRQTGGVQARYGRLRHPSVAVIRQAINELGGEEWNSDMETAMLDLAENHSFRGIRKSAMEALAANRHEGLVEFALTRTPENEPESRVRVPALHLLDGFGGEGIKYHLETMTSDSSYHVAAAAIRLYGRSFPDEAHTVLFGFMDTDSHGQVIKTALAEALSNSSSVEAYEMLYELAGEPGDYDYIRIALAGLAVWATEDDLREEIGQLYRNRLDDPYEATRNVAGSGLQYLEEE